MKIGKRQKTQKKLESERGKKVFCHVFSSSIFKSEHVECLIYMRARKKALMATVSALNVTVDIVAELHSSFSQHTLANIALAFT